MAFYRAPGFLNEILELATRNAQLVTLKDFQVTDAEAPGIPTCGFRCKA